MKKKILRYCLFYLIDAGCAYAGFIYGFGLRVTNWWAFLGALIVARFLFHTLNAAYLRADIVADMEGKIK